MTTGDSICPMWLVGSSSSLYYYYGQDCTNPYNTQTYGFAFPSPVQTGCFTSNCTNSYGGAGLARAYRPPVFCPGAPGSEASWIIEDSQVGNPLPGGSSTTHPSFYYYSTWVDTQTVDLVIPAKSGQMISVAACLYHWFGLLGNHFVATGVEWAGTSSSAQQPDWGMPISTYTYLARYNGHCYYIFTVTPVM